MKKKAPNKASASQNTTRILTVSNVHREWGADNRRKYQSVPALRLNGNWLAKIGFVAGQRVRVIASVHSITIAHVAAP
jgi:Toxin SymE, type I toxin-antitoxin system